MSSCHTTSGGGENRSVPAEGHEHGAGATTGVDFYRGDSTKENLLGFNG